MGVEGYQLEFRLDDVRTLKPLLLTCPKEVKLQSYKGLIRPVLEYACTAWDPHQPYLQEKSGTHITLNYKKNWKKTRKELLDLLHHTTTIYWAPLTISVNDLTD
jgi:hypothetical protein